LAVRSYAAGAVFYDCYSSSINTTFPFSRRATSIQRQPIPFRAPRDARFTTDTHGSLLWALTPQAQPRVLLSIPRNHFSQATVPQTDHRLHPQRGEARRTLPTTDFSQSVEQGTSIPHLGLHPLNSAFSSREALSQGCYFVADLQFSVCCSRLSFMRERRP